MVSSFVVVVGGGGGDGVVVVYCFLDCATFPAFVLQPFVQARTLG